MPDRLRAVAREITQGVVLELVVLSSGYDEIIAATPLGRAFDRILASGFHEVGADGTFTCVKRVVGHPAKALYLEALGKGADVDGSNGPERAGDPVRPDDMHVPFDQMIYLGDGASDLQAFGFLHREGGLCIAVGAEGGLRSGSPDRRPARRRRAAARLLARRAADGGARARRARLRPPIALRRIGAA